MGTNDERTNAVKVDTSLEDRAHAGLLARCVAQCELVLPGGARSESLGAEDGARVALIDL